MSSTQEVGEIFGEGRGPAHAMLRSPTVLIASVGLWGMNVFFYRLFGINYIKVLRRDLIEIEAEEKASAQQHQQQQEGGGHNNSSSKNSNHHHHRSPSTMQVEMVEVSDHSEEDLDEQSSNDDVSTSENPSSSLSPMSPLPPIDRSGAITWERLVTLSVALLFLLHFTYV